MLDLELAIAHHILIFVLFGVLASELALVRTDMSSAAIRRIAFIDLWYGIAAAGIVAVGFARAVYASKGWEYYSVNAFFWAKIGAFVLLGLLSIWPTVKYIQWNRRGLTGSRLPGAADVARIRRILWTEIAVFAFIPALAAAMARGYG